MLSPGRWLAVGWHAINGSVRRRSRWSDGRTADSPSRDSVIEKLKMIINRIDRSCKRCRDLLAPVSFHDDRTSFAVPALGALQKSATEWSGAKRGSSSCTAIQLATARVDRIQRHASSKRSASADTERSSLRSVSVASPLAFCSCHAALPHMAERQLAACSVARSLSIVCLAAS